MSVNRILVISAHPDDEALGCGGTLVKHVQAGDSIHWLIITGMQEKYGYSLEKVAKRSREIEQVQKLLKCDVTQLGFKPAGLNSENFSELVGKISEVAAKFKPDTVYCVNRSDAHSDHRYVFEAALPLAKSFRYPSVKKFLMYECVSETEFAPSLQASAFVPNYFVDISQQFKNKNELIEVYNSEMGQHPFPRSLRNIEALAIHRGAYAGVEYAEAFQLLKFVEL